MKSIRENLVTLGVPGTVAKVIEVLSDAKPHTLHEIEVAADLRQSEVSIAVGTMAAFVTTSITKSSQKGRPQKIVQMSQENCRKYVEGFVTWHRNKFEDVMRAGNELLGEW